MPGRTARCVCGKQFQLTCWNWNRALSSATVSRLGASCVPERQGRAVRFRRLFSLAVPPLRTSFSFTERSPLRAEKLAVARTSRWTRSDSHDSSKGQWESARDRRRGTGDGGRRTRKKVYRSFFVPAAWYLHFNREVLSYRGVAVFSKEEEKNYVVRGASPPSAFSVRISLSEIRKFSPRRGRHNSIRILPGVFVEYGFFARVP